MQTIRRFTAAALLAGCLTAACTESDGPRRLRSMSIQSGNSRTRDGSSQPELAAEGRRFYTLTVTLPDGITPNQWSLPVLIDHAGQQHRASDSWYSIGSDAPSTFTASFEIPENAQPAVVRVGAYDLDIVKGIITERPQ